MTYEGEHYGVYQPVQVLYSTVSSSDKCCPNCGAPNEGFVVVTGKRVFLPETIEELE